MVHQPAEIRQALAETARRMALEMESSTVDQTLVEMAYRWGDIEEQLPGWFRPAKSDTEQNDQVGSRLSRGLAMLFESRHTSPRKRTTSGTSGPIVAM